MEKPHDALENQEDDTGGKEGDTVAAIVRPVRLGDAVAAAAGVGPLPCHRYPHRSIPNSTDPNRQSTKRDNNPCRNCYNNRAAQQDPQTLQR